MIRYAVTFIFTLALFFALDMLWITVFAGQTYRETLGVAMVESPRVAAAFLFYPLYVIGLMVFVAPKEEGWQTVPQTFMFGALFGLFAYGTFDLTNYTVMQAWTPWLAFTDIAWGVVCTGIASALGVWIGELLMTRFFVA